MSDLSEVVKIFESKHQDCISFSKKHLNRKNDDLHQYYEGAKWAFEFVLETIKEKDN